MLRLGVREEGGRMGVLADRLVLSILNETHDLDRRAKFPGRLLQTESPANGIQVWKEPPRQSLVNDRHPRPRIRVAPRKITTAQ